VSNTFHKIGSLWKYLFYDLLVDLDFKVERCEYRNTFEWLLGITFINLLSLLEIQIMCLRIMVIVGFSKGIIESLKEDFKHEN